MTPQTPNTAFTMQEDDSTIHIALGALPGLPTIALHWPFIDFECGPEQGFALRKFDIEPQWRTRGPELATGYIPDWGDDRARPTRPRA